MRRSSLLVFVWLGFIGASCKSNDVSVNTYNIGNACGVGVTCADGSCALGYCRKTCSSDADCGDLGVCLSDGTSKGCRLAPEAVCSASSPCSTGLICSADGSCRTPCDASRPCDVKGQTCSAGACVASSPSDAGADTLDTTPADTFVPDTAPPADAASDTATDAPKRTVVSIAAGGGIGDSCVVLSDGHVWCWTTAAPTPVEVAGLTNVKQMVIGNFHRCALLNDQTLMCWGAGTDGQIGDGFTFNRSAPTAVTGLVKVKSVAVGETHTCASFEDGSAKCWGKNTTGAIGDTTLVSPRPSPTAVNGLTDVAEVVAGYYFSCARLNAGGVKCWGYNSKGQLGNNDATGAEKPDPVSVKNLTDAIQLTAGYQTVCARTSTAGVVKCWGYNDAATVGDTTTLPRLEPVVADATNAKLVVLGGTNGGAITSDDGLRVWGKNSGALGDGKTAMVTLPVTITGLTGVKQIAMADTHSCVLLTTGEVRCTNAPRGGLPDYVHAPVKPIWE